VDISETSSGKILAMMDELMKNRAKWREKIVKSVSDAREMIYAGPADTLRGFQIRYSQSRPPIT
jgi:hypothetical protein